MQLGAFGVLREFYRLEETSEADRPETGEFIAFGRIQAGYAVQEAVFWQA